MKLTNKFVVINLLCVLFFILSFFGVGNWAIASVVMVVGVGLSTLIGSFIYSKSFMSDTVCRLVFSAGFISSGLAAFKIGEYLNQTVYDGLVTLFVVGYFLLVTALLHYMGKKTSAA